MARIRNNHKSPLGLATRLLIQPGKTVDVPNWDELRKNKIVAAWVSSKLLTVVDGDDAEEAPAPKAVRVTGKEPATFVASDTDGAEETQEVAEELPLSEDKDELIAELAALGYDGYNKRSSVATLQEAVTNARAEVAAEAAAQQ